LKTRGFTNVILIIKFIHFRRKSEFVKETGYGGAMIWALDLDDFENVCGCEKYPLLKTINRVLRDYPTPDPKCDRLAYSMEYRQQQLSDYNVRSNFACTKST
jgi:hypothetical protein